MPHPLTVVSPYPQIDELGNLHDGYLLKKATYCEKKCTNRICTSYPPGFTQGQILFHTCPHQFSVACVKIGDDALRINGVVESATSTARPDFLKTHRNRKINHLELSAWISALQASLPMFLIGVNQRAQDSVAALHDIKAVLGTILKTSESWVWEHDGYNLEDKLINVPEQLKTIYQSCRIVESLLQLADIVANPEAARFGEPRPSSVHGMLYMLVRIYESKAKKKSVSIDLNGYSYNRPNIYRSFIILPLVLIDNAVKYAEQDTGVHIRVNDVGAGVRLEVSSIGQTIALSEQKKIFDRGFRGNNISRNDGSGLGLWTAHQVAGVHNATIQYTTTDVDARTLRGTNIFAVTIPGKP